VESGNPLGAVLGPDQHAVARTNAACSQQRRKAPAEPRDFRVSRDFAPVALVPDYGDLVIVAAEVVEERSQMVSHGCFLQDRGCKVRILDAAACAFDTLKRQSHQTFNEIVLIMTLS
jgi:hypothetical protein